MSTIDLSNYTCSDKGLLLPAINEYTWHVGVRAFLYLLTMVWFFLGTAIVSDTFMCGIEKITSKTKVIKMSDPDKKDGVREIEVKVWNDTVANLTLMAFGTSAPEILLNVIEILKNQYVATNLGPGTIVGSAAFNLLCITAICIVGIPSPEIRKIENKRVYAVTSFFCIFAYVWMIIVLMGSSPGQVDLWEAVVTLLFFPVLILTSYAADKKFGCKQNKTSSEVEIGFDFDSPDDMLSDSGGNADIIHLAKELGKNKSLTEAEAAKIAASKIAEHEHHNSMWYRIHATRALTGGHRLIPKVNSAFKDLYENITVRAHEHLGDDEQGLSQIDLTEGGTKAVVEFTASSIAVLENEGRVRVGMKRHGRLDIQASVWVETIDGTAEAGSDYKPIKQKITFNPKEILREVYIEIVDDDVWEPDEIFFVKLFVDPDEKDITLGKTVINQVTIINDDEPGKFEWSKPSYIVKESSGIAQLFINRVNGADGAISVSWKTKDLTAVHGKEYIGGEGVLNFAHGETTKSLSITVLDSELPESEHNFQVELFNPTGGSEIGKIKKTIVTLVTDDEFDGLVSRIAVLTKKNLDYLRLDTASWGQQFVEAMNVNGGDVENATKLDYVLHYCSFFWKVLFAFIPPPSIGGGWLTFALALAFIGLMTALIGDLATIFGCLVGLNETVTAITLVALGTSMPDTFASKAAALNEKYADSSVGNINGSNAVNVFLGLGIPWLIASSYWMAKGGVFLVPKGTLGFSVILYTASAILTISVLLLRRNSSVFGNGELGGPKVPKILSAVFVFSLWVIYIILSSLQSYKIFVVDL